MDERIIRIEEKCAFLEHDMGELDEAVRELASTVTGLDREVRRLRGLLEEIQRAAASGAGEDDDEV